VKLDVYLEQFERPIGTLADDTAGTPSFAYADDYLANTEAMPLSASMPLRLDAFPALATRAVFANLLPEGRALDELAGRHGVDPTDLVGLLAKVGGDCAGAVSVVPDGAPPPKRPGVVPNDYVRQSERELADEVFALATGNEPAIKLPEASLAGVQRKTSLYIDDAGVPYRPNAGAPTTHIIKVADDDLDDLIENETFCLALSATLGLKTAKAYKREVGGIAYIAVERYDRRRDGHTIHRLHQEDFAQALGLYPTSRKYSHRNGPSAEDCFRLADLAAEPAIFKRDLLRALILAFLTGNADAHAKNFSLLHGAGGIELAPLYDLVCIALYPRYAQTMALSIGGEQEPSKIDRAAWRRLAKTAWFGAAYVEREVEQLTRRVLPAAETLADTDLVSPRVSNRIRGVIGHQVRLVNAAFGFAIPDDAPPLLEPAGGWTRLS
jgi:serine/threonine-protein kinase HipA